MKRSYTKAIRDSCVFVQHRAHLSLTETNDYTWDPFQGPIIREPRQEPFCSLGYSPTPITRKLRYLFSVPTSL